MNVIETLRMYNYKLGGNREQTSNLNNNDFGSTFVGIRVFLLIICVLENVALPHGRLLDALCFLLQQFRQICIRTKLAEKRLKESYDYFLQKTLTDIVWFSLEKLL